MVRKKLAVAILALSALQANFANAMGLGNLSVKSALNQPLNAEIKLLDTGDLDPSQIKIQLAGAEDFQRAGVDRDYFLTNLRFTVDMDGHGGATIKVTTREPVVEPYLNFVIEARWPNGRLLREFAVLLDPPTFSANKAAAPVTPATSAGAQPVKPKAAQPPVVQTETEATASAPSADMSLPAANNSGEYRVQVYDTLSKIAARFKPANDVSVAQTMIAIQRANPQVFIRNNVNLIKSGYVLRLPNADEVRAITADQAAQEVDAQTQEWRGGRSSRLCDAGTAATGPQLDASAPEPSKRRVVSASRRACRLPRLATPIKHCGEGAGSSGKGVEALRQQLTESQESLEKGKRDNKELQSRLDDMERQIATLQRLISLKDDQLSALQAKSADAKPAPQSAPEAEKPATPATTEPATAATPAITEPAPQASAPEPVAKPAPVKPVAKPPAKPAAPAPASGLASKLVADPAYLYGGIAAILIAMLSPFVFKRFQRRDEESELSAFEADDDFKFDAGAFDTSESEHATVDADAAVIEDEKVEQPVADAPKKAVRSETGDPIAESDIYIAYGRYQQAVDLLTTAIDAEPNRSDLRMKLLEVYVEMRNKDAFRQQFVALQGLGDSGAIAHVKDLLSSVDGISDWLDDLPGTAGVSTFAAAATAAAVTSAAVSVAPDLGLDLDFDSEPAVSEPAAPTADLDVSDDLAALTSSFANDADMANEESPIELDLNLDDDLLAGDVGAELSDSFLNEPESAPSFDTATSFTTADSQEAESFDSAFEAPSFEAEPVEESSAAILEDEGLELDLGDDDLDQALSSMGETEGLGDLEDMSKALGDLDSGVAAAPVDLGADLDALPEEFDLSQPGTELPEVDRTNANDFGDLSFDEPSFDEPSFEAPNFEEPSFEAPNFAPAAEPEPAMDVFAGLNQSTSAAPVQPAVAAPTLDGGDDFDFLADADEVATKLDLARAYIDMGDTDGARDILDEVLQEGTDTQKQEASTLLSRIV